MKDQVYIWYLVFTKYYLVQIMKGTLPVLTPDVLITKLLIYGLHLFGQLNHTACENIKLATIFASKRYIYVPLIKLL